MLTAVVLSQLSLQQVVIAPNYRKQRHGLNTHIYTLLVLLLT